MNSVTPDRFLKHVNLRTRQLISDREEVVKDRFIEPDKKFESKLLKAIKEKRLDTREKVRKEAEVLANKIGRKTKGSDTLQVSLRKVYDQNSFDEIGEAFKEEFGKTPAQYIKQAANVTALHNAWDRLYCLTVAPDETNRHRDDCILYLKAVYSIQRLAEAETVDDLVTLIEAYDYKVLVPKSLFPAQQKRQVRESDADRELLKKIKLLAQHVKTLSSIRDKVFSEDREFHYRGPASFVAPKITSTEPESRRPVSDNQIASGKTEAISDEPGNWLTERIAKELKVLGTQAAKRNLFAEEELKLLNSKAASLLGNTELGGVQAIENSLYKEAKALIHNPRMAISENVAKNPDTLYLIKQLKLPKIRLIKSYASSSSSELPRVHQLGVGDLHVLEQQINRYEMGEVAHIENVMGKESRNRTHTRLEETESTHTTETEETVTDERSLQTTDRYELSKESEKQTEATLEASAGFSVSASYGVVTASASGNIATTLSTSSSQSTSTNFSREIVEKSVSEITSRVREESVTRVLSRIEEVNSHGFNNDTSEHIIGIYRWVDKYYTVRNVNYGRRLMLEMIIPEPAAGYLYAEQMHPEHEEITPPPDPITFDPEDLTRYNYLDYMAEYNASDVEAPPDDIIYRSVSMANRAEDYTQFADKDSSLSITDGYKSTNFYGSWGMARPQNSTTHAIDILVGGARFGSTNTLSGLTGNVAVSVLAINCSAYHTGIRVRCELTDQAFENWQASCWSALQTAYEAAVSDYESKVAAAEIGAGVEIHGRNPDQNEEIIRTELKRGAIKYLSNDMAEIIVNGTPRYNEVFDAADSTGDFDLEEAKVEGAIIQFFEQAFEWENMMWKFYPYIWARASEQHEKLLDEDTDPTFREFRRAGAARVVLPVPIEYQEAVLHFFETNEIWQGGEPPVLNDPEYISIIDDLMDGQLNSFNSPIYYQDEDSVPPYIVDEWEIKLPTSLVKLQEDSTLPNFATSLVETDADTVLDQLAAETGFASEWRNSIINLLTLLGMDTSEDARREMAADGGYPCNPETDPIHNINEWLYDFLLVSISAHGLPE